MTDKPFFSVVIPTLNEEKYLPKLLNDLAAQIDKSFEVIVVDGNSEDKTAEKANALAQKLPQLEVISAQKRNVSYQRNLGAKQASGQFLVFIDADAQIPINYLSEIHCYMQEKDKSCEFLTTWMKPDTENKTDVTSVMLWNMLVEMSKTLDKPFISGSNIVVKRTTFWKYGVFDEKIKLAEDQDLAFRLNKSGINLHILKSPKMTMSLRRVRREGSLGMLRKYTKATFKMLLEGPITEELFDYPMGGKVVTSKEQRKRADLLEKIKEYL